MQRTNFLLSRLVILFLILTAKAVYAQIYINEFLAANISANLDESYNYSDWIEIHNSSSEEFDLLNYHLSDDPDFPLKYKISTSVIIPAKGYKIVLLDKKNFILGNEVHANFSLDVEGEFIGLYGPEGNVADSLSYGRQIQDVSFGRISDDKNWAYFGEPTPGAPNSSDGFKEPLVAGEVIPSKEAGFYQGEVFVELQASGSYDEIRYTLNGDYPDESSTLYNGQMEISASSVLRARCFSDTLFPGPVRTISYFIDLDTSNLPIVSLSTNNGNFYDPDYGIYTDGTNGITGYCSPEPVNWAQDWERAINFEYFSEDGELQISQLVGVRIFGACSRNYSLKSLALISREDYGRKGLKHKFFQGKDIEEYKSLVLRNSGNDVAKSMLRDGFMQSAIGEEINLDYQAYQPVLVYLNGEYFALMNLREKVDEHYVKSNYNIDEEEVDFLENGVGISAGDREAFNEFMEFLRTEEMENDSIYDQLKSMLDVDEFMNFYIANIFYSNEDWPQNNLKYWRQRGENQQWRWVMYDTDDGYGGYPNSGNTLNWATRDDPSTEIFTTLLENESFKTEFAQRFAVYMNTVFNADRLNQILDSLEQQIRPHIEQQIALWGLPYNYPSWLFEVDDFMPDFTNNQKDIATGWLLDYFGFPGQYELSLSCNDSTMGSIRLSGANLPSSYSGLQFLNAPVRLEALPHPGFVFLGWSGGINSEKQEVFQMFDSDTSVIAHFQVADTLHGILINELLASNDSVIKDEMGEYEDWIEIVNIDTSAIDLAGLFLSDSSGFLNKYKFPREARSIIAPGDYLLLWADSETSEGSYHLPFKLKSEGDAVYLSQKVGDTILVIDSIVFSDQFVDASFGRNKDNPQLWEYMIPTPLDTNKSVRVDNIYINELMASNSMSHADTNGEYDDWFEIFNGNDFPVDIGGIFITDSLGQNHKHRMPVTKSGAMIIPPRGYIVLWADDSTEQGNLHLNFKLSAKGEQLGLIQPDGKTPIDTLTFGVQNQDISFGRIRDGEDGFCYQPPSPGDTNRNYTQAGIVINEIMAADQQLTKDEFSEYDDWIELYNSNDYPVNIAGMYISDNLDSPEKYQIGFSEPTLTTIPERGYLILWADNQPDQGILHLNFGLKAGGEQVGIYSVDKGTVIDTLSFTKQFDNFSDSKFPDNSWWIVPPTPGSENTNPIISGLHINEIMADNDNWVPDEYGEYDDWIEVYNSSDMDIHLAGLYLSDSLAHPTKYRIPSSGEESLIVPAHGYKLIWMDNDSEQGGLHTNFKLSRGGDAIGIFNYQYTIPIDTKSFSKQPGNFSFAKLPGSEEWLAIPPTPTAPNALPDLSGLHINEFMTSNSFTITDEYGQYDDWIELYNGGSEAVNIAGLFISDSIGDRSPERIRSLSPDQTKIAPGGFILLWADDSSAQGILHLDFKLSRQNEQVVVYSYNSSTIIDSITYLDVPRDNSYGRRSDGDINWVDFPLSTPGKSNTITALDGGGSINSYSAFQCYPNPASTAVNFRFNLERESRITVRVYNSTGDLVAIPVQGLYPQGSFDMEWDLNGFSGSSMPNGIYLFHFETNEESFIDKLMIMSN